MQAVTDIQGRKFELSDRDFRFLAELAKRETGIVLTSAKKDMVYGRLVRRLRALNLNGFDEYCALLQSDAASSEMEQLVNAVTTNLTGFFREPHHFDHLRETLAGLGSPRHLRLWSSACSSGMEPYSMAMILRDAIPDIDRWDAKILATDIDTNMVKTGAEGLYKPDDVKAVPDTCRRFMKQDGDCVTMDERLRKLISYRELNLLNAWPMKGQFDIVFCRNVVIYFDAPTKTTLFDRMADIIKPDGLLYIGHSENLHGVTDRFKLIGRTIYRRIA